MDYKEYFEHVYLEKFENALNFLLDPANKDRYLKDVEDDFYKQGGQLAGKGVESKVYIHSDWPYAIKVFPDDHCYLRFIRYTQHHPHPCFPKTFGSPQRIMPQYKRHYANEKVYMLRIEKLSPLVQGSIIYESYKILRSAAMDYRYYKGNKIEEESLENLKNDKRAALAFSAFRQLYQRAGIAADDPDNSRGGECRLDMHDGNIMVRPSDGNLIITDPTHGSPFDGYRMAQDLKYDAHREEQALSHNNVLGYLNQNELEQREKINILKGGEKKKPSQYKQYRKKYPKPSPENNQ
jgi:hypothetical protein